MRNKLVILSEVLRTVISPFCYDDLYVPVLAPNMIKSIEAPFPCHLGLVENKLKFDIETIISSCSDKTLVVLLDSDELAVRYKNENMTLQEFQNHYDVINLKRNYMTRKQLPGKHLPKLTKGINSATAKLKESPSVTRHEKSLFVNKIRGYFMNYFAQLFKNYEKFITYPKNKDSWDMNDVFDSRDFLNSVDSSTDFYSDLLITRTWIVFIENKVVPSTVEQVQRLKQFDEIITNLQAESFFSIRTAKIAEEPYEEKEQFEYLFYPENFMPSIQDFKEDYIDAVDVNNMPISKCLKIIEYGTDTPRYLSMASQAAHLDKKFYYFKYVVIPGCSPRLELGPDNFQLERFAPDLSKLYSLPMSTIDSMDMHLKQRSGTIKMSSITSQGKDINILIIWLMMWILLFEYVDESEKQFRVEQMIGAMHRLFMKHKMNQKQLVLQDVFETVLDSGSFHMVKELYEYLNVCKIRSSSSLDNIYFNAIRKHNEMMEVSTSESNHIITIHVCDDEVASEDNDSLSLSKQFSYNISEPKSSGSSPDVQQLSISPMIHKELKYEDKRSRLKRYIESINLKSDYFKTCMSKFRRRTFKHNKDCSNFILQDILTINLDHECENCGFYLNYQQIISCYKSSGFYCMQCKEDILPSIHSSVGLQTGCTGYGFDDIQTEIQPFITEAELRGVVNGLYETVQLQKRDKIFDIMILREIRSQLFWNCLVYFMHYELPYDCLLPYAPKFSYKAMQDTVRVEVDDE